MWYGEIAKIIKVIQEYLKFKEYCFGQGTCKQIVYFLEQRKVSALPDQQQMGSPMFREGYPSG